MPRKVSFRTGKVWQRLKQWYGTRIVESYGDLPPDDWCELIDRTDDERLETALLAVRRASPIHPPTLGQLENAIPRREVRGGPSLPQQLATYAIAKCNPCAHQTALGMSFFGHEVEIASKSSGGNLMKTPVIKGVAFRECETCEKPSMRVLTEEMIDAGVAA